VQQHRAITDLAGLETIAGFVGTMFDGERAVGETHVRRVVHRFITEEIPSRVAADTAYQNAKRHSDKQNARIEHDKALVRIMTAALQDDTQLFKEFSDNESFRRWLTEMVFGLTYGAEATEPFRAASRRIRDLGALRSSSVVAPDGVADIRVDILVDAIPARC
jgi:predicted Zn-dependent protease